MGKEGISNLIKKEMKIEVAKITEEEKTAGKTSVGNLSMQQIVKIAKEKKDSLLAKDLKSAVKQVIGTANSMTGVLIENKRPKEISKEVDEDKWNSVIQ